MVEIAHQAFSADNFELAAEIYERNISSFGPRLDLYLGLGKSYAKAGRINSSLEAYFKAYRIGKVNPEELNELVESLVRIMQEKKKEKNGGKEEEGDMFNCDICKSMWIEPISITCGHTFCKGCLERTKPTSCVKCKKLVNYKRIIQHKSSVLLHKTVEKWFSSEHLAVKLKKQGNDHFKKGDFTEAINYYSQAFEHVSDDHLLISNRSYAYANLGRYTEALHDADRAIELKPDWPKGYFRRGAALGGLYKYEEAAYAYLQCLSLDANITSAKTELIKMLNKILTPLSAEDLKERDLHNVIKPDALSSLLSHSSQALGIQDLSSLNRTSNPGSGKLGMESLASIKQVLRVQSQIEIAQEALMHTKVECQHDSIKDEISSKQLALEPTTDNDSSNADMLQGASNLLTSATTHGAKCYSEPVTPLASPLLQRSSRSQSERLPRKRVPPPTSPSTTQDTANKFFKINNKRDVPENLLHLDDFECPLCFRLLFNPVTTPCGHTFCRGCLDRCMDHSARCPLCKFSLVEYLAFREGNITEAIERITKHYFPIAYMQRQKLHEQEIEELTKMGVDQQHEVPIFVCTMAFPSVHCPLHVFEPRYRLMIRQCMESGTRQFGMCVSLSSDDTFAEYGTMLEIQDVQYFPDGRSVVDTVGGRRFKVLSRGSRDGYHTAKVEFLKDVHPPPEESEELRSLHTEVHQEAQAWFQGLPKGPQSRINQHFGPFPPFNPDSLSLENGPEWSWWEVAVLPLDTRAQLAILAMTSLKDRLLAIKRVLSFMKLQKNP